MEQRKYSPLNHPVIGSLHIIGGSLGGTKEGISAAGLEANLDSQQWSFCKCAFVHTSRVNVFPDPLEPWSKITEFRPFEHA